MMHLIESEKEYFFVLRYALKNWERGDPDHLNCPLNRLRDLLEEYGEKGVVECRGECLRYLEYSPNHRSSPCPCDHFGCEEAQRVAWEWIRKKEKFYEDR